MKKLITAFALVLTACGAPANAAGDVSQGGRKTVRVDYASGAYTSSVVQIFPTAGKWYSWNVNFHYGSGSAFINYTPGCSDACVHSEYVTLAQGRCHTFNTKSPAIRICRVARTVIDITMPSDWADAYGYMQVRKVPTLRPPMPGDPYYEDRVDK